MKRCLFLILLVLFNKAVFSQVITGSILDSKTDSVVCFASVFISGTFVGTQSDSKGHFKLDLTGYENMSLSVSAIGYQTLTLTDYPTTSPLKISLVPVNYDVGEVVVKSKSLSRKRRSNLKLFNETFLGTTNNGLQCEITNEQDIHFNYESDKDTLKAFSSLPLIIKNNSLGYTITYYLKKFEYYRKSNSFIYEGNYIFTENNNEIAADRETFIKRREEAYHGSFMHFFRALWTNSLVNEGYTITDADGYTYSYKQLVGLENRLEGGVLKVKRKYLIYHPGLIINYNGQTQIEFINFRVYFNELGYFDGGLQWSGEMIKKRVGDLLPYEYRIDE